ncbi:hypothetical protein [Pareuzebyella sediminis]|uniref:hypothetical protein n=1 Tax=Pareuzebyella sediminis TaxID=2607998 RepID=UPI0011EE793B|nr:hypothetical protein [Pareuzebyella sediminis]
MLMINFRTLVIASVLSFISVLGMGQNDVRRSPGDSLTLAQAYMNLSLTEMYFDSLETGRISKILPFESAELRSIVDKKFIKENSTLYHFTISLLHFNGAQLLYRNKTEVGRKVLIAWKNTLEEAIGHFNLAKINQYNLGEGSSSSFYNLIKFDNEAVRRVKSNIENLKYTYTAYFNEDIYPDFKRVYQRANKTGEYDFEALLEYAKLYNFPLEMSILNNRPDLKEYGDYGRSILSISNEYPLDQKLQLIAEYLQLRYLTTEKYTAPTGGLDTEILYASYEKFVNKLKYAKDAFIKRELTPVVRKQLYEALQKKFPPEKNFDQGQSNTELAYMMNDMTNDEPYFFPDPAPLSSAFMSITNFKPQMPRLGQVDDFLRTHLSAKGYDNQLRYWYDLDGFALSTGLEKFNKDGSPTAKERRFVKMLGGDGQFSYYEIFKSIFFEIASEFRMFVFVVATKGVTLSDETLSASRTDELLRNSYATLPDDLKNKTLSSKDLSVLVYHFHQNDIGQVPMLDLNSAWTAKNHLQNAGLLGIIEE